MFTKDVNYLEIVEFSEPRLPLGVHHYHCLKHHAIIKLDLSGNLLCLAATLSDINKSFLRSFLSRLAIFGNFTTCFLCYISTSDTLERTGSAGYRAPELPKTKKATTKTDIYSLWVIILELLSGKSPNEAVDGSDLPQWVASTVKEEWTNEVFDLELMRDVSTTGDEMLNTLKLALHLVDPSPEARPDVQQVLRELEEINPELIADSSGIYREKPSLI
ncbi:hypothetical protein SOVF_053940 [Spinacia oleracea]|nr:hypothetical protein SOVF_053940 [Spinacia oleracea]